MSYPVLSPKFAMKIGDCARLEDLDAQGWSDFAQKADLGLPFVRRRVAELAARIAEAAPKTQASLTAPGFTGEGFLPWVDLVQDRAQRCTATLTRK